MRCYMRSSASSRYHDVETDDILQDFSRGVSEFKDQYQALIQR